MIKRCSNDGTHVFSGWLSFYSLVYGVAMIYPPKSFRCTVCSTSFQITSESFTGQPFTDCEKCGQLAERIDHEYIQKKGESNRNWLNKHGYCTSCKPIEVCSKCEQTRCDCDNKSMITKCKFGDAYENLLIKNHRPKAVDL